MPVNSFPGLTSRVASDAASPQVSYTVEEINQRSTWDDFLLGAKPHTFLQSWQWGEFNQRQGNRIFRFGLRANADGQLVAIALVLCINSRRARFLFCPHGPIFRSPADSASLPAFVAQLRQLTQTLRAHFIRFSPLLPDGVENRQLFRRLGFHDAPIHMHPELAWLLDIRASEQTLLMGMRKTMRQLIRRSQAAGVVVSTGNQPAALEEFFRLYRQTAQRQHFVAFSERYIRDEVAAFNTEAVIFLAKLSGETLAGAIVIFSQDSGFYHHGASLVTSQKVPAAYLLQWMAILEAKRRGCQWYNFWGIAPDDRPKHPWAGLSTFKKGFGGFAEAYVHAQDYAASYRYWLNYTLEWFRRHRRGL